MKIKNYFELKNNKQNAILKSLDANGLKSLYQGEKGLYNNMYTQVNKLEKEQ